MSYINMYKFRGVGCIGSQNKCSLLTCLQT